MSSPSQSPKIVVTRRFPGGGFERLAKHYRLDVNPSARPYTDWQLKRAVRGAEAIVCLLTDKIDAAVMGAAGPQLKLIANYAVGYDNIDCIEAAKRRITVTNTPGTLTDAVAEHTFALLLAVARRIAEADRFTRAGRFHQWDPDLMLGLQLAGKTLGLIGLGRIGSGVARMAKGFNMRVIYHDEIRQKEAERELGLEYHHFDTVIESADVISLHVPLLPTTKHLIAARELKRMKPTAILINTARGPVVDERALTEALGKKIIWGAGLDVFEHEPLINRRLAKLPTVILTPHIASATAEAREQMSQLVADNVINFFEHGRALNPVKL